MRTGDARIVGDQWVFVEWVSVSVEVMTAFTVNNLTYRPGALYRTRFICVILLSTQNIL